MFKRTLIAALILVPAVVFAAEGTAPGKSPRAGGWFKKADVDGNGMLSRAEVEKAMPRLADKFESIDSNKDGQLSRGELRAWTKSARTERRAKAADRFRHADTDGDGAISRAEAEKSAPRLARKFDLIDANKDGKLTQDELRAYRESKRAPRAKA